MSAELHQEDQAGRRCTGCGQVKPPDAFPRKSRADGGRRRSRCRGCTNAQLAAYRALHPEQRARFNAWRRELRAMAMAFKSPQPEPEAGPAVAGAGEQP